MRDGAVIHHEQRTSGHESLPARAGDERRYYSHVRTDVLALCPQEAVSFLSVGCGAGYTEAILVERGCRVVGIEMDARAAASARSRGVEALEGDASSMDDRLRDREFDCLIYADILEHLPDPQDVLRRHVSRLVPGGSVVISVPNFRHHSVFRQLFLNGWIRYTDAGIFDRTHVRITTRRMVESWLRDAGLVVDGGSYQIWRRREKVVAAASLGLLREFCASQVLVRATKRARP